MHASGGLRASGEVGSIVGLLREASDAAARRRTVPRSVREERAADASASASAFCAPAEKAQLSKAKRHAAKEGRDDVKQPIKLTQPQLRGLAILRDHASMDRPISAGFFAGLFWPDSPSWNRVSHQGVRGQWMPGLAGRFLYRLCKLGLASQHTSFETKQARFYISAKGRQALAAYQSEAVEA